MKRLFANLQKIEDFILVATFTVMVLASFAQVVNRNIIHAGVSWLEELARYCMVYMALLATEAGLRDNTQISITAITDKIHGMTGRADYFKGRGGDFFRSLLFFILYHS